jgi:hypothetical protein
MPTIKMFRLFYVVKPLVPRLLQIELRRWIVSRQRRRYRNVWPIDANAVRMPQGWMGWPNHKQFALVLTHDVDTQQGHAKCLRLMNLEKDLGFRSSFNFVPERYSVSKELRNHLTQNGFEVGLHGLKHDGKLYSSKKEFNKRAIRINAYLNEWGSVGFRSPSMHHNLDWIHALDIKYDASTFDTDPFEPQSDGVRTIFPFKVSGDSNNNGYIELPYTLVQDFTLFILMKETGIDIWKQKIDWIAANGGMALLNTHPDYMNFGNNGVGKEEYAAVLYKQFLEYVDHRYHGQYWHVLPRDMATYFSNRSSEKLPSL